MKRIVLSSIFLIALLGLVACTANAAPTAEATMAAPTVEATMAAPTATLPTPTLTPTEEIIPTPEPTATSTPEPTATATPAPPTPEPEAISWKPQRPEQTCQPSDTRTCSILYILADKYDDEHVFKTQPHLEKAGYTTFVASYTLEEINGFHECYDFTPAYPELLLEDVDVGDYDAILFAGGDGNTIDLHDHPEAHRIAQEAVEQGKVIAAVGDGPVILAKAGLLEGVTVTVLYNVMMHGITDEWRNIVERYGAIFEETPLVRDGLLITADFGTMNLAWAIIEALEEQVQ